ncbi:MAG: 16S rRNA (cytidine(1402)-2'-O)-methyltransferase [Deltaproteobacteria bacterium]|nr:16S rRNA (cytidine(1402)-2'-O)-methyltransferase [Deltaproteobacteria bacterium]
MNGTLYIVATPIGNLEDITFRAVRVLKEADLIAAEDTRHTQKLLTHYGIKTPVTSYFEHNRAVKGDFLAWRLREGKDVALVSDAGTPGVSDPGYELIKGAIKDGIRVVPIPGPSAAITGLSISGLPTGIFAFEGFLPAKEKARNERLETLRGEERSLIFYESPQRLLSTLKDIHDIVGDRNIAVLRELTKIHEEVLRGRVSDILEELKDRTVKGEVVIVLEGNQGEGFKGSIGSELEKALKCGLSMKEAIEAVSKGFGISKGEVYKEGLKIKLMTAEGG